MWVVDARTSLMLVALRRACRQGVHSCFPFVLCVLLQPSLVAGAFRRGSSQLQAIQLPALLLLLLLLLMLLQRRLSCFKPCLAVLLLSRGF